MPLDNLRAFVDAISAAGELARVERPVSVDKEVTEIADRCMKSPGGGPALLFRHPTLLHGGPSRYPVAVNLFGSARRMALALGVQVAIGLGGDLGALHAASATLPPTIDEFLFGGALRKEPVPPVKAVTTDLEVPAEAESVIEGYVDPGEERVLDGPFGDHTGFYS